MAAQTPVEQFQQQIGDAVEALRVRSQEAAGLAVKVAYASVGAFVVAQERVAALVNAR